MGLGNPKTSKLFEATAHYSYHASKRKIRLLSQPYTLHVLVAIAGFHPSLASASFSLHNSTTRCCSPSGITPVVHVLEWWLVVACCVGDAKNAYWAQHDAGSERAHCSLLAWAELGAHSLSPLVPRSCTQFNCDTHRHYSLSRGHSFRSHVSLFVSRFHISRFSWYIIHMTFCIAEVDRDSSTLSTRLCNCFSCRRRGWHREQTRHLANLVSIA